MPAKINLLNQKFGKLTVIEETDKRKNKSVVWKCQCDCGNMIELSTKELRSDGIIQCPNCGNDRFPRKNLRKDIVGEKFNHLTVLEASEKRSEGGKILYKCQCDCDKKTILYTTRTNLITNQIRSCGCQKSKGEFNIIQILQKNNIKFIKEFCFPNSLYRYDFALLDEKNNIVRLIEFDGEQHYKQNIKTSGWNTRQRYEYTLQHDLEKNEMAKEQNIPLVRIPYWERNNIDLSLILGEKYLIS